MLFVNILINCYPARLTSNFPIVDVDALCGPVKSTWNEADQKAHEQREADKEARYQRLLATSDPVATVVKAFSDTLMKNPDAKIGSARSTITVAQFQNLLPDIWFSDEIINAYLSLLVDKYSHCENLVSTAMVFAIDSLRKYHEQEKMARHLIRESPISRSIHTLLHG